MRKRLSLEDCHRMAESKGGKCLSLIYINSLTPMKWYCDKCEYEWKAHFNSIKNINTWCPKCAGCVKHTIEDCINYAESK